MDIRNNSSSTGLWDTEILSMDLTGTYLPPVAAAGGTDLLVWRDSNVDD